MSFLTESEQKTLADTITAFVAMNQESAALEEAMEEEPVDVLTDWALREYGRSARAYLATLDSEAERHQVMRHVARDLNLLRRGTEFDQRQFQAQQRIALSQLRLNLDRTHLEVRKDDVEKKHEHDLTRGLKFIQNFIADKPELVASYEAFVAAMDRELGLEPGAPLSEESNEDAESPDFFDSPESLDPTSFPIQDFPY